MKVLDSWYAENTIPHFTFTDFRFDLTFRHNWF